MALNQNVNVSLCTYNDTCFFFFKYVWLLIVLALSQVANGSLKTSEKCDTRKNCKVNRTLYFRAMTHKISVDAQKAAIQFATKAHQSCGLIKRRQNIYLFSPSFTDVRCIFFLTIDFFVAMKVWNQIIFSFFFQDVCIFALKLFVLDCISDKLSHSTVGNTVSGFLDNWMRLIHFCQIFLYLRKGRRSWSDIS